MVMKAYYIDPLDSQPSHAGGSSSAYVTAGLGSCHEMRGMIKSAWSLSSQDDEYVEVGYIPNVTYQFAVV